MTENVGCTVINTTDVGACLSERVEFGMNITSEFDVSGFKS